MIACYNCVSSVIQCTDVVRDLGDLLDRKMTTQRQIRNYFSQTVMSQLVMSLVITRIDYCNSIIAGLPACRLVPLQ